MKSIFEEYGKVILSIIVIITLLVSVFGGIKLFDLLGAHANVDTEISHSKGTNALKTVTERAKPTIEVPESSKEYLRVYKNVAFQPLKAVVCKDAEGETLVPVITSIRLLAGDGTEAELVGNYDKEKGTMVLNPSHYDVSHKSCSESEFVESTMLISDEESYNLPGLVIVTYKAIDNYNVATVKTVSFVVDNQLY